ncbi:alkaline phosphatase [Maribacter sp. BPC-D8]|uniref:alkaline phosphatase n=1 Tax=Maribacter sp. BPC-D8 TaxID=3053613 RepID=UPI002B46CC6F|nr:alkaline phosphatase [Maribacter sp. BPC-D8]WRI29406.1 alkaline phosphatase [Maribacter sp. BPC-D8]
MIRSFFFIICPLLIATQFVQAQQGNHYKIHSHNDYLQTVPFWSAYANELESIEVDVFCKNKTLYATHSESDIIIERTFQALYLQPIQKIIELELGNQQEIQLLIDIKSEPYKTLDKLISILEKYPDVIHNEKISIVISGNRPEEKDYANYADYITFDHQTLEISDNEKAWEKIALVSLNFNDFSEWNGKGRLTAGDYKKVKTVIDSVHSLGKSFRFWGAPDSKTAWKVFKELNMDFINTDKTYASAAYLKDLENRMYTNEIFSEVYIPTFSSDKKNMPIKNVILLIGDGNGLSQISSSLLANGGDLTLAQMKSIGFITTQSADDFTTDSAAAGTALATGERTYNRAIGVDTLQQPLVNYSELLSEYNYVSGCITSDRMTGATPGSFYAHQKDRSDVREIAGDLSKSKLSLFVGGGSEDFQGKERVVGYDMLDKVDAIGSSKSDKVGFFISEKEVPSVLNGRGSVLAEATKNGIQFLSSKNKPFFLMVEGAQIDNYGHTNNVSGIVSEGIDFDRAITEAVKYADKMGNTLVIVTADHETSGFSIPQGNLEKGIIEGDFTTHDHTATMVPIFAYGPHSQEFQGVYKNSDLFGKILKVLDLKE